MTGVKSRAFTNLTELVTFMNTPAVTTVISVLRNDAAGVYEIVYQ
jgi:hypothetical protein